MTSLVKVENLRLRIINALEQKNVHQRHFQLSLEFTEVGFSVMFSAMDEPEDEPYMTYLKDYTLEQIKALKSSDIISGCVEHFKRYLEAPLPIPAEEPLPKTGEVN